MTADLIYGLFSDALHYDAQVTIESVVYTFRLYFEDADGCWYWTLLDEAATVVYRGPRRLLPVGPWLTVDEPPTFAQIAQLYDLATGFFPGLLMAVSSQPLAYVAADADTMEIQYFNAATVAAAVAG